MFADRSSQLWNKIEGLVQSEGLGLYDLEQNSGTIKVTLCSKDGVKSGDCSRICKRLLVMATVEGETLGIGTQPQIEVNSPGINRVLRVKEHFFGAVGERVRLILENSDSFPAELLGEFASFEDDVLKIVTEEGSKKDLVKREWNIPFMMVKKAKVDFKF